MRVEGSSRRIWLLITHYAPNFSGAAVQAHRIMQGLIERGYDVTVLCAGTQAAAALRGRTVYRDGIEVRYLYQLPVIEGRWLRFAPPLHKALRLASALLSNLSLAWRQRRVLRREGKGEDVLQLFSSYEFSTLPIRVARAKGQLVVIRTTLVGSDTPTGDGRRVQPLARLRHAAFRMADAVVNNSSEGAERCVASGIDPARVLRIPNGVDLGRYSPVATPARADLARRLGLDPERRYVLFVGSAQHRKGIDVMARAFVRVARKVPDADLLIVGPNDFSDLRRYSPDRQGLVDRVRARFAKAGFVDRVHWVGTADNVDEFMKVSAVFCLPTRREGSPNAVAEAMATGLPVVVARLPNVTTDLVRSAREGVLVHGHQPREYAHSLVELLTNEPLRQRMGAAARGRIEHEYGIESTVDQYMSLYEQLRRAGEKEPVTR